MPGSAGIGSSPRSRRTKGQSRHEVDIVGTVVFFFCAFTLLCWWDLNIRLRTVLSVRLARRYIDRNVSGWCSRLVILARAWTGLSIVRDRRLLPGLPDRFLVIANHQSLVDIPLIMSLFPRHTILFVAKDSLGRWMPAVSQVLRLQRHALVNRRANFGEAMRKLERLGRNLPPNGCPTVFPEGTRSRTGEVKPFNLGAVRKIEDTARLPIVSIVLDGGHAISRGREFFGRISRSVYRIRILSVHPAPENKQELQATVERIREEFTEQLQIWREDRVAVR